MALKSILKRIEKKIREEQIDIENPTKKTLELFKLFIKIREISKGKRPREIKPKRLETLFKQVYKKFNDGYEAFKIYLVEVIEIKMRELANPKR